MAYEPTIWNTGDVISAAKLNKIENGLADSMSLPIIECMANDQTQTYQLSKSYDQLMEMLGDQTRITVILKINHVYGDSEDHIEDTTLIGELYIPPYDTDNNINIVYNWSSPSMSSMSVSLQIYYNLWTITSNGEVNLLPFSKNLK